MKSKKLGVIVPYRNRRTHLQQFIPSISKHLNKQKIRLHGLDAPELRGEEKENGRKIRDLLRLNEGSVIELDRLAGDPLDILVNGTMIAQGEVVMVGERFGVRFSEIVDPEKRVESI